MKTIHFPKNVDLTTCHCDPEKKIFPALICRILNLNGIDQKTEFHFQCTSCEQETDPTSDIETARLLWNYSVGSRKESDIFYENLNTIRRFLCIPIPALSYNTNDIEDILSAIRGLKERETEYR